MELREVVSSNIKAVGYDEDGIVVEYLGGAKYKYEKAPKELFEELMKAESKGKFINSQIKGKFEFKKL